MATFILTSYAAQPYAGGYSIALHLGGGGHPFPSRKVTARTTKDALAALATYAADVKAACTDPVVVSAALDRGQRAPRGWRGLTQKETSYPANF